MRACVAILCCSLTACAVPLDDSFEQRAEQGAASAISVLYPNTQVAPVAQCVRDISEFEELLILSNSSVEMPEQETLDLVTSILAREEVADCVAFNGVELEPA